MALDKKKISFIGIIGIGLSAVIGSGIWKDPLKWSNSAGILCIVALLITWLLFLTSGLAYSECVSMFPKSGGPYSYVGGAFNKKIGTYVGILYFIGYLIVGVILAFLTGLFTLAAIDPVSFSLCTPGYLCLMTVVYLVLFTALAGILSPRLLGFISIGWVSIKVILLVTVTILALINWNSVSVAGITGMGFQGAINSTIWALLGFEIMLIFAGETKDVEKTLPKAILIVLPIILVVYAFISLGAAGIVSIGEIPQESLSSSLSLLLILATKVGLPSTAVFIFAAFSAGGTTLLLLATCIHQLRVLSRDNAIPKVFNKEHKGIQIVSAPVVLGIGLVIGIFMTLAMNFWDYSVDVFAGVGMALIIISALFPAGITALYLRIKLPALERPFKSPIFFIIFPLSVILSIYLLYLNFADFSIMWIGLIIFGVVLILTIGLIFLIPLFMKNEKVQESTITTDTN